MKAPESQQSLPCMMRKMKALVNCVISSTQRGASWGQGVGLLPDWTSWGQEECRRGEGPGRNHPCWRPGSPWLEGGRGEPGAASCSSGQISTLSWERTHGPEGRRDVSPPLLPQTSGLDTHLDSEGLRVVELGLGAVEILVWLLMLEHKMGIGPSTRSASRIES